MKHLPLGLCQILLLTAVLTACGGGGGGSSDVAPVAPPPPSDPEPQPTRIELLDAVPASGATMIDPGQSSFFFVHPAQSDLTVSIDGDCLELSSSTVRRSLVDLSADEFDELASHYVRCALAENTSYTINANGTRSNDARFIATQEFSTGTEGTPALTVLDQFSLTRATVDDLFRDYVEGALVTELDLPSAVESVIVSLVVELADANWDNLTDPQSLYPVTSQRVSYRSRRPDGAPSDEFTGLITFPVVGLSPEFTPRDRMIVLNHATGSTPGDLADGDAWYILANLFASRGYLVVAPDNYGRGGTDAFDETYLMANRTADNALHLIKQALADEAYDDVYAGTDVSIIGYSQGGHSAIALWQLIELTENTGITVSSVYAGGAPYNLYQTVRGVLQHVDGSCNDEAYCRYVDSETTLPFATDRILPGILNYTDTGLALEDVVVGSSLAPDFVSGFLAAESAYDTLKSVLQLNSFTRIANAEVLSHSGATVHLYHSKYDRLVPLNNTEELAATLAPHVSIDLHENRCNSDGYEVIFNLTEQVGALHTLCGLAVLDDAMADLR